MFLHVSVRTCEIPLYFVYVCVTLCVHSDVVTNERGVAKARLERVELELSSLQQQVTGYVVKCLSVLNLSLSLTCSAAQEWHREKNDIIALCTR